VSTQLILKRTLRQPRFACNALCITSKTFIGNSVSSMELEAYVK
jgi:hypothetical protein